MNEQKLFQLSILATVLGLLFLFFIAGTIKPTISDPETIQPAEQVTVQGTVEKVSTQKNAIFITVKGYKPIKTEVIVFEDEPIFIEKGDYVQVSGTVEEYKNKKEIIADEIIKN